MPKDKREEIAKKHTLSVRAHENDWTLLTIYTDGSKTKEGTGASYIMYHKGHPIAKKSLGMGNKAKYLTQKNRPCQKPILKFTSNHPHKNIKTLNFYMDNVAVVKTTYDITLASGQ
jgi:hypothetical protein